MFYICLCICFLCLFCVSCVGCVLLCLGMVFSRFLPAESIIGGGWASSYWTLTYKKEVSWLFFKPGLNCFQVLPEICEFCSSGFVLHYDGVAVEEFDSWYKFGVFFSFVMVNV